MINNRLLAVASYINHEKLADIGSDHAYLPIYAIEQHKVKRAVAGEVVQRPLYGCRKC